jgi:hypothetical protein
MNRSNGQSSIHSQIGECGVSIDYFVNWSRITLDNAIINTHHTGMPLIEEIQEDEAGPSRSGPSFGEVMRELAGRLALPEELLTNFMGGDIRAYT